MRGKLAVLSILSVMVLFLLAVNASAAMFTATVDPISPVIKPGEKATFKITILNSGNSDLTLDVFSPQSGFGWNVDTFPLEDRRVVVKSGATKNVEVYAQPLKDTGSGIYKITLKIQSVETKETWEDTLKVFVATKEDQTYLPSLKVDLDLNDKLNPQETQSVKVLVENENALNFKNLLLKVNSDMPEFAVQQTFDLKPLAKKFIEFTIKPNPYQQPKEYFLFFVFERNGETVKVVEKKVNVITMTPEFSQDVAEKTKFLKTERTILVKNGGNVKNTQQIKIEAPLVKSIFTTTNAQITKSEGKRYYTWELSLGPGEEVSLKQVENLRIPFYLLFLICVVVLLYFTLRSPLVITKSAISGEKSGGVITSLKVTLAVKNVGSRPIKNIEVFDIVPGIGHVEKELESGTVKPADIKPGPKGTVVKWKIGELDAKEERLIHYRIRAKLNILGTMQLPKAKGKFETRPGKFRSSYSNIYSIGP